MVLEERDEDDHPNSQTFLKCLHAFTAPDRLYFMNKIVFHLGQVIVLVFTTYFMYKVEITHFIKGSIKCTPDLVFHQFGLDEKSKYVVNLTCLSEAAELE